MRLRARQHRFVAGVVGGWSALRLAMLWPGSGGAAPLGPIAAGLVAGGLVLPVHVQDRRPAFPSDPVSRNAPAVASLRSRPVRRASAGTMVATVSGDAPGLAASFEGGGFSRMPALPATDGAAGPAPGLHRAAFSPPADLAPAPPQAFDRARLSAETYLFVRPGSGSAALAAGGQLGGSQAALRLAYALNASGPVRTAVAARIYAPIQSRGKEAAVGLDWHPLPGAPLRVSIERRQRLDGLGRSAVSAYAAGGFFLGGLPLGLEADGYGQAGLVGVRRRDGFVDGALRAGRSVQLGELRPRIGAGVWGAAQPGVARLDVGPRASLDVPVAAHAITVALDGRLRVAGHARPGSGVALTLATGL